MKYSKEAIGRQDVPVGILMVSAYDGGNRAELTNGLAKYVINNLRRAELEIDVGATVIFDGRSLSAISLS